MKTGIRTFCLIAAVLAVAGTAGATLTPVGTATYNGSDYNLIWDDAQSLVWLDYSAPSLYWPNQMAWAAGLDGQLTYNWDPAYSVTWAETAWRLPDAGAAPSYGCQAATQELGHLYYTGLGLEGGSSTAGATAPDLSSGPFENLTMAAYWTRTEDPIDYGFFVVDAAWMFAFRETRSTPYNDTVFGFQDIDSNGTGWLSPTHSALAVRGAQVQGGGPVIPEPATLAGLVLGAGGLVGYVRRRRR